MTPRVLITGATGFVGSHVTDAMLEAGYRVRCLVRASSSRVWLTNKPVEIIEGDLCGGILRPAVEGVDTIIHCAGATRGRRATLYRVNRDGTCALLEACSHSGRSIRFVHCSSLAAAGPAAAGRPVDTDDPPQPTSDYGRSKLAAEKEVLDSRHRLEVVVLRPSAVYGPRDRDVLPVVRMVQRGLVLVPGLRRRDVQVVHVKDLALAFRKAVEQREAAGKTYFVAHPEVICWSQIVGAIGEALGKRPRTLHVPAPLLRLWGTMIDLSGNAARSDQLDGRRLKDVAERAWTCRVEKTITELDWSPEYDVARGMNDVASWYRGQGWL